MQIRSLNTNLRNEIGSIYKHWAYAYNNSGNSKTCYIYYSGLNADKASLLILATGNASDRCCCRHIKLTNYGVTQSTMYQGSTSACWNGNVFINNSGNVVDNISEATGIALTNVEGFTRIEIYACGSVYIENSYFS